MKKILRALLYPFVALSALGLLFSIAVHVAALLEQHIPAQANWLLPGIFVVWFPTVITASLITKDSPRRDFWKIALRGAPPWMRYMIYGFFIYAVINFIYFIVFVRGGYAQGTEDVMFRVASGHALAFYSAALGILYSATQMLKGGSMRTCPQGHPVSSSATFCEKCGQMIFDEVEQPPSTTRI